MRRVAVAVVLVVACHKDGATKPVEEHDATPDVAPSDASADATEDGADDAAADAELASTEPSFFAPGAIGSATPITHDGAPAVRYAALTQAVCEAELDKRKVPFLRGAATLGVKEPVRLRGPLHGVSIHSMLPEAQRAKSDLEIFDCRLVLALDDFTTLVAAHDVVEMIHFSAYRSQKNGGCTPKHAGKQHCAGLALDVATYVKKDGTTLDVKRDFGGKIGSGTCEPGAHPTKPSAAQAELWGFVCEAARRGLFHVILTPNFNAQHENHMHLEVATDTKWILIH